MPSSYVNNLRLQEIATGEQSGTWGGTTNTNLELVGQALGYGTRAIANASTDNITIADGTSDADRSMYLKLTGGGQACTVTLLPNTSSKMWIMENATSYTLTFSQGSGANVAIKAGQTKMIFADGLGGGAVVYELGTVAVQNIQADGTVTVGIDDTGYDVTFFGATTGKKLFWDESEDTLNVVGTAAFQDGAAATPSITNTGDLNTGFYFPAADTVGVTLAGALDFQFEANDFTALSGSVISTNTIAETTATSGVTIDGLLIKDSTAAFADGAVATPSITNTGDVNTGIYFPAADTVGVVTGGVEQFRYGSNPVTSKNLVINGGCTVAQRGTQTGQGTAHARTAVDMFHLRVESGEQSRYTTSQDTGLSVANSVLTGGHRTALKIDCTTAEASVAAGERQLILTSIEAQNLQHLEYGAASAKTLSLSFGISSPKSGTHCVALYQTDGDRHYIMEFTVASANTFERIKIEGIPGDTGGTINNDNDKGLWIAFPLIAGSNWQNTADTWANGEDYATSNQQNLLDNTSNNIWITGLQLEVGSVATDFEHEGFGVTYLKCKRYLPFYFDAANNSNFRFAFGAAYSTSYFQCILPFLVPPRAAVTISVDSIGNWRAETGDGTGIVVTAIATQPGVNADNFGMWSAANFQSSSGYTAKEPGFLRPNGTSGIMIASCEI